MYTEVAQIVFEMAMRTQFNILETCKYIQSACTGEYQQYSSTTECAKFLNGRPNYACKDLKLMGPSYSCTWLHAQLISFDPNHCFHTGKGLPDKKGKIACSITDCKYGPSTELMAKEGQCVAEDGDGKCLAGWWSPNEKKCMPYKLHHQYCNAVQECVQGLTCVDYECR